MFFGMYYIFVDMLLYQVNREEIKKIVNGYFVFHLLFFIFELYFRIQYGNNTVFGGWIAAAEEAGAGIRLLFYKYKFYSIMGGDSNFSSLIIYCVLSVAIFIWNEKLYKNNNIFWCFIFLLFLIFTFSRSMIISLAALILYLLFYYKKKIYFKFCAVCLFACFIVYFYNIIHSDVSFLSKFEIFFELSKYMKSMTLSQFFFGNGTMSSVNILSLYSHNIIALFIIEYGVMSLLLFFLSIIVVCVDTGKYAFYVLPILFGMSISYTSPYLPFLWTAFALIKHLDRLYGYKSVVRVSYILQKK